MLLGLFGGFVGAYRIYKGETVCVLDGTRLFQIEGYTNFDLMKGALLITEKGIHLKTKGQGRFTLTDKYSSFFFTNFYSIKDCLVPAGTQIYKEEIFMVTNKDIPCSIDEQQMLFKYWGGASIPQYAWVSCTSKITGFRHFTVNSRDVIRTKRVVEMMLVQNNSAPKFALLDEYLEAEEIFNIRE